MENKSDIAIYRRVIQAGGVLVTILLGIRHILPGDPRKGGAFDAFCPFGGIETLWAYITTGQTLKTTNLINFTVLLAVLGVSLIAGRAFCGWMCPLGTLQDMLASWSRRLSGEKKKTRGKKSKARFPMDVSPKTDKWLRYLKYVVLVVILVFSTWTIYPPLRDLCPARAIFSFHWNTSLLGIILLVFIVSSMLVKRFSCKYICPLGAVLAIFNKVAPVHLKADMTRCTNCGRCDSDCPMDISPIPENLNHRSAECIQCLECMDTCAHKDSLTLRVL